MYARVAAATKAGNSAFRGRDFDDGASVLFDLADVPSKCIGATRLIVLDVFDCPHEPGAKAVIAGVGAFVPRKRASDGGTLDSPPRSDLCGLSRPGANIQCELANPGFAYRTPPEYKISTTYSWLPGICTDRIP